MMLVARARPEAGPSGNECWQTTEMRDPQSKPRMMESRTLLKGRDFYRPNGMKAPINCAPTHLQDTQDKTEEQAKIHRQTHRVVTVITSYIITHHNTLSYIHLLKHPSGNNLTQSHA